MIIQSEFRPSWWLSNPHLQTIVASKLGKRPQLDTRSERIELVDGDFIDVNYSHRDSGPVVCLFHGLAGCIESAYIKGIFHSLENRGMRPVLMHWRGCSGEPNRLPGSYHSGQTHDIRFMLTRLREQYPGERLLAAGYSLGGNALLKYLGEAGTDTPLTGAVSICPPLVLGVGADKLDTGLARGYQRYLLGLLRDQHNRKRERYPELNLKEAGSDLNNFWKFDDAITAPLNGFRDVHDYYQRCSARPYLRRIQIPAHVIYALDDPFFTAEVLPAADEVGRCVTVEESRHGGHVGFLSGSWPGSLRYWLDDRVADVLEQQSKR